MATIKSYTDELWKDVVGWEGLYQVSSFGRVKSFRRKEPHLLSTCVGKHGYRVVLLYNGNGQRKNERVHRLVAQAFIPNPNGYPYINHKDEDRTNNCIDNLEWCTQKYNNSYGTKTKKQLQTYKERNTSNAEKEVVMLSLEGDIVNVYKSLSDASRQTGLSLGSLSEVCNKMPHRLTLGGYKWKFKE